jgi:hypothetical protein
MRTRLLQALALALIASACSASSPSSSVVEPGSAPSASSQQGSGAPQASELLDFRAPLLDGGTLDGTTLAGKDVAFWFWAPW